MIPYDDNKKLDTTIGKAPAPRITKATPKLDPELNPNTYGPANGFLNSVCINKPEIDNPIPTKIAIMAFGSLKLMIMYSQVSLLALDPNKLLMTSLNGIATCPKLMFITNVNTNVNDSIEKRIVFRLLVFKLF